VQQVDELKQHTSELKGEELKMDRKEIIAALQAGNYKIEHREDCNCSFDWSIEGDTITDNCYGNECWEGKVLIVGGEEIAESIRYDASRVLIDDLGDDDIPDDIWDEMRMSDMVEQGDSANNDTHESNRRDALICWLEQLVADDKYRLMRDNERGFANEFVVILVSPDADPEDIDDDWDELTVEEWADQYLYSGDAATQDFSGCKVI
jgi:hypothetical protein